MTRLAYDTDLSDDQWKLIAPYLPAAKSGGQPTPYCESGQRGKEVGIKS